MAPEGVVSYITSAASRHLGLLPSVSCTFADFLFFPFPFFLFPKMHRLCTLSSGSKVGNQKIHLTCFIEIVALLWWSRTEPTVSLRSVYIGLGQVEGLSLIPISFFFAL